MESLCNSAHAKENRCQCDLQYLCGKATSLSEEISRIIPECGANDFLGAIFFPGKCRTLAGGELRLFSMEREEGGSLRDRQEVSFSWMPPEGVPTLGPQIRRSTVSCLAQPFASPRFFLLSLIFLFLGV